MWVDSHCHLDAPELAGDIDAVVMRANQALLRGVVIPTVQARDFLTIVPLVEKYVTQLPQIAYTLGIHPLFTKTAKNSDIDYLEERITLSISDPRFIGIGEIGLDYFVTDLDNPKQEWFFEQQLRLAKKFNLPVILHVRRSQDQILKRLRQIKISGGIAHAFNGSEVQADNYLQLNFKLGFGGAMTYARALQIRRLATSLPLASFVLETDCPDIPPAWIKAGDGRYNEPAELAKIAQVFAGIRNISLEELAIALNSNLCQAFPRWADLQRSLAVSL